MPLPSPIEPSPPDIVGRALELQAVKTFLDAASPTGISTGGGAGTSGGAVALLVEGEAGVGKSMLWRAAVGGARERAMDVLSCEPAAVEQALSFVALRDLIGGLPDEELEQLPPPQRRALGAALLRETVGEAVDQGALGVAPRRSSGSAPKVEQSSSPSTTASGWTHHLPESSRSPCDGSAMPALASC
ncbi:MAG: hypothetical protein H0U52_03425 [Chloroflexi bacterium]|nr:hypothetical protein [Chloroflexota bacterium]